MTAFLRLLVSLFLLVATCSAAELKDHVIRVQRSGFNLSFPPTFQKSWGTGICIDQACSVIVTAYHVELLGSRPQLRIPGRGVRRVLSLASENDLNKGKIQVGGQLLSYNPAHDVSFVYFTKGTPRKTAPRHSYKPNLGQKVIVVGYPDKQLHTLEARLIGSNVPLVFNGTNLKENLVLDVGVTPGFSGGGVFDQDGHLLGMIILYGLLGPKGEHLEISVALPLITIAKALLKLDPSMAATIFNDVPQETEQVRTSTPPVILSEEALLGEGAPPTIPDLTASLIDLPNALQALRSKSASSGNRARNLIAKECLTNGTRKPMCHEVAIVDGQQIFRIPNKKSRLVETRTSLPLPKQGVWSAFAWSGAFDPIDESPWVFQGSINNQFLFTLRSTPEDDRCWFEEHPREIPLFGGGHADWEGPVACFEEIVTDQNFNIVAWYAERSMPENCLTETFQTATYYEWTTLEGSTSPSPLPVSMKITAKVRGQERLMYATTHWTEYRQFRVDHEISF